MQVYGDARELGASVAKYLSVGFDLGEPALVIATPEHWEIFSGLLAESGWSRARIEERGLLEVADAETTLAALMEDGRPSASLFDQVIGGRMDEVSSRFPDRRIRAFGEMVDLLAGAGDMDGALELETLWNRLAARRSFSLLCGYSLDVFDPELQASALPAICRSHSHMLPAEDPARLERAVGAALDEVLGKGSEKVYELAGRQLARREVPTAQLALMWVSSQMPRSAERILHSARERYAADTA